MHNGVNSMKDEKERLAKLIAEHKDADEQSKQEDCIDYAEEFRRQTGKDLISREYIIQ